MIDPKLDSLPVDAKGDFEDFDERTITPEQAALRTRKARAGLSINDTIAANATMSVGGLGADTSGVAAGSGAGAGTTYLGPGNGGASSPAPTIVPRARAAGSTMRGEPAYELNTTDSVPTTDEISALAYEYWTAKGCPAGSHEDDWRQAEEELIARRRLTRAQGA
jgi:hypothetical protein